MECKTEYRNIVIPTYETGKPEELPVFYEKRANQGASSKMYPIPYTDRLTDKVINKSYRAIVLENDYIKVTALPEIGGKIHSATDKHTGYDFVYTNKVIKPAMIALAGPWVSGGIEFNWPLHHRPTTYEPMFSYIAENEDGSKTAWMGETEPYNRQKGMVGLTVPADRSYIRADVSLYNGTPVSRPFLWWANLAVQVDKNYAVVFPPDVDYVNDHDRRAVLNWPIAKGTFATARPYDYGDGVDIHYYRNIVVPSSFMVSKGQSDSDFLCGYDHGRECGTVAVANHYIAPGKKLWTWGNNGFGYKWCSNLTDDGSRYVELMTGCYADNQPDFTYIAPYETKRFTQFWYPVHGIGEVKNATIDAAVNLEKEGRGCKVGFCVTGVFKGCTILVRDNGRVVLRESADLSPETAWVRHIGKTFKTGMSAELLDANGVRLVEYTVRERGTHRPIEPRKPSPRPEQIATVEELYLHGKHIVQYKHFTFRAEDYFAEGLRRDPEDARCNEAMGDLLFDRGQFEEALAHYERAERRLELRNANPEHTDVLYKRGMCKRYLGKNKDAYQDLYWSTWGYQNRSAGYYALAGLASLDGDVPEAVRLLRLSLETNVHHLWAKFMLAELTQDETLRKEIEKDDPLFLHDMANATQALDFAIEFMHFGMYSRAIEVLEGAEKTPMTEFYLAYLYALVRQPSASRKHKARAEQMNWVYCNPNRLDDIAVLQWADSPRANYYLGCLYYDKDRYEDAAACWHACMEREELAPAYRGYALACYDHLGKKEEAKEALEHAFRLAPESDRTFYELSQLYKSMNMPASERIAFFETHRANAARRDDCTLEYAQLLAAVGRLDEAKHVLAEHRFHTYEGGEGNLTGFHAWLFKLIGDTYIAQGEYEEAFRAYRSGLTFPRCYGEEKSFFVNDAPLYLGMSRCAKKLGKKDEFLEKACYNHADISVHSYWQALALREAGKTNEAQALIDEMLRRADETYANRDMPPYFGVGAHTFLPFMYDVAKYHTSVALQLRGYAMLAQGDRAAAEDCAKKLMNLDCGDIVNVMLFEMTKAKE